MIADSIEKGFQILKNELADNKYSIVLLTCASHLYFCNGNLDESKNYLLQAYDLDSTNSWTAYYIGKIYHFKGDSIQEKRFFNKTLELEEKQKICMLTPFVYCFTGKPTEAIKKMKAEVKKDNSIILNLASVYGILGMKKECLSILKKYMKQREMTNYFYISHSSDYASVRNEPGYQQMMELLKEK